MSIEVAVLRSILFDYVRQARNNYTLGLCDAEKIHGCVTHNFASLTDQAFDIPLLETTSNLK